MSRYFALPVLATVLALVAVRAVSTSAPVVEAPRVFVFSLPAQEPEAPAPPPPPAAAPPQAAPAAPPPRIEPTIIVLEPLPQAAPVARTEVIERTVYVPQQPSTVVYAPTTIYAPVIETAPAPQEVVEYPVIIVGNAGHGRPFPPSRRPQAQPDPFFKTIPFQPPTPRGPRWSP